MKRWIVLMVCLLFCMTGCGTDDDTRQPDTPTPPDGGAWVDSDLSNDPYVRLPGWVSEEMLTADFWIDDALKSVVMTAEEIAAYNQTADKLLHDEKGKAYALRDLPTVVNGSLVRHYLPSKIPTDPTAFFVDGKPTSEAFWKSLLVNCRRDAVQNKVTVMFGYSVRRTNLRSWPTDTFIGEDATDTFYDANAASECLPYLPVAVLHESADGKWYYCVMYGMRGWVEKDAIALCEGRDEWEMRMEQTELLVVTGKELRLTEDPLTPALSNLVLPMGTTMPLMAASDVPDEINGRRTYGNYVVLLPTRGEDGMMVNEYALIPVSEDVQVGHLPYTRENVLLQAFKLLGDRYGWAGMFNANDCSGMVHEIFTCFGLTFPRASVAQYQATGMKRVEVDGKSVTEKQAILDKTPAGTLLYFPGHIMIYLGKHDGRYYCISSTGTFLQNGQAQHVSSVVINTLDTERANGTTWLQNITAIQWVEPK